MEWLLGTVLIPLVALAYQQGWIPPKCEVTHVHPCKNALLARIFVSDDSPRMPRFIIRHMVAKYKNDGFKIVRLAFSREFILGQEVIWKGKVSDGSIQECVLMAKPNAQPVAAADARKSGSRG